MHKVVSQLTSAKPLQSCPKAAWERARKKAKGAKAKGHTYERWVGRFIERTLGLEMVGGQWWQYIDETGINYAQTDYFIAGRLGILLLEVKLTQTDSAFLQMSQLYVPILKHHFQLPVYTLQVCKNLRHKPTDPETIQGLIADPRPGNFTWHLSP